MEPAGIWRKDAKLIELDVQDGALGASLVDRGFGRFLGVSQSDRRIAAIAADHPTLAGRLTESALRKIVQCNNADVLILSGRTTRQLWRYGRWRHAGHVAWPLQLRLGTLVAAIAGLVHFLLGRVRWGGVVPYRAGPKGRRYLVVLQVRRPKRRSARYYLPHALGVGGFLNRLSEAPIRHVVLRWFESLPDLSPTEDLDLLVDDHDFEKILAVLAEGPGIQPCDVYTVTGLPGSDYYRKGVTQNVPYYPPRLAEAILQDARPYQGLCRVPSEEHHFLSLAYHAVYHKGPRSGIPSTTGKSRPNRRPAHDYAAVLEALARKLGIDVRITLEDLDAYLASRGWRPPRDMLARLGPRDPWIRRLVRQAVCEPEDRRLSVFILRREGLNRGGLASLVAKLEHYGFDRDDQNAHSPGVEARRRPGPRGELGPGAFQDFGRSAGRGRGHLRHRAAADELRPQAPVPRDDQRPPAGEAKHPRRLQPRASRPRAVQRGPFERQRARGDGLPADPHAGASRRN